MATDSAERMRRMRGHAKGSHETCNPDRCEVHRTLANQARNCIYARAVLDYCRDNGIPWESLGTELQVLRSQARFQLEGTPWLAEQFTIDWLIRMEARYITDSILYGKP